MNHHQASGRAAASGDSSLAIFSSKVESKSAAASTESN